MKKKIYFASDQHFGAPTYEKSRQRESIFVNWLLDIEKDAQAIFLLGDLFDFWFEYKTVIPKGFIRVLGTLASITDKGIPIHFFVGNHDLWMVDYFKKELDITVYHKHKEFNLQGKTVLIGHGDGLGPKDLGYKYMKKLFVHPFSKFIFRWLHPDIGMSIAKYLSIKNKIISGDKDVKFLGEDKEWLIQYCKKKLNEQHYDYFLFGHRHLPIEVSLSKNSTYINTGDWIGHFTYAEMESGKIELKKCKF